MQKRKDYSMKRVVLGPKRKRIKDRSKVSKEKRKLKQYKMYGCYAVRMGEILQSISSLIHR